MVTSGQAPGCSPSRLGKPCPAAAKCRPPRPSAVTPGASPSRRGRVRVPGQAEYPFADDVELDVGGAAADGECPGEQYLPGPVRAIGPPGGSDGSARAVAAERAVRPGERPAQLRDPLGMAHPEQLP